MIWNVISNWEFEAVHKHLSTPLQIICLDYFLAAKRRLAFMNKVGYDRFKKNQQFAPIIKWEAFKKQVEVIKDRAETFENAYNVIKESIKRHDDVNTIVKAPPQAARIQVVK